MKLYTPLINKALGIAYAAHHGQADKSGAPYIYHPAYLASQMETEDEIITALLHDVVEDTDITIEDLEREGFPPATIEALKLLTHDDGSGYSQYIDRIGTNPLATKVKLADLRHNGNPSRNANLPPEDAVKYREKYGDAVRQLEIRAAECEEILQKADGLNPYEMFRHGVQFYWGNKKKSDRRKAFELFSRAMEIGLPKDREYFSDDNSELNAARFLVPMLLRDDDGILSQSTEPFWFEKPLEPFEVKYTASRPPPKFYDARQHDVDREVGQKVSAYLREVFLHITGRGGVEQDIAKAEDIAQSIVLLLSFGDRDHDPAITLRSILQNAMDELENGAVKLRDW